MNIAIPISGNILVLYYWDGRSFCAFHLFPLPSAFHSVEYKNIFPISIN